MFLMFHGNTKCYNNQVKSLLVECGKKYLPPEILYRKKSPYPKTYDPTYEKLLGTMVIEEYKSNNKLQKYIDYNKLIKFINSPKDYGKPWYGQLMAGPQMLAYVLQISYMLRKYNLLKIRGFSTTDITILCYHN
ncbi:MAG: asparagine synthase-related protein [Eubacterium ventriosum]